MFKSVFEHKYKKSSQKSNTPDMVCVDLRSDAIIMKSCETIQSFQITGQVW